MGSCFCSISFLFMSLAVGGWVGGWVGEGVSPMLILFERYV